MCVLPFCDYFGMKGAKGLERLIVKQLLLKLLFKYFELVIAVNEGAVSDCISRIADTRKKGDTEEFSDGKGGVFFILLGQRVGTKCWGCVRLTW